MVSENNFAADVVPAATVPNARLAGLMVKGRTPVPLSATVCGESGAVSLMASEPVSTPPSVGVNVTVDLQVLPAASVEPQLVADMAKFPVAVIELMLTVAVLEFLNVTVLAALVVPTDSGLNARLRGDGVTIGALATVKGR